MAPSRVGTPPRPYAGSLIHTNGGVRHSAPVALPPHRSQHLQGMEHTRSLSAEATARSGTSARRRPVWHPGPVRVATCHHAASGFRWLAELYASAMRATCCGAVYLQDARAALLVHFPHDHTPSILRLGHHAPAREERPFWLPAHRRPLKARHATCTNAKSAWGKGRPISRCMSARSYRAIRVHPRS